MKMEEVEKNQVVNLVGSQKEWIVINIDRADQVVQVYRDCDEVCGHSGCVQGHAQWVFPDTMTFVRKLEFK